MQSHTLDERLQVRLPSQDKQRAYEIAKLFGLDDASSVVRIALRDLFRRVDAGESILAVEEPA